MRLIEENYRSGRDVGIEDMIEYFDQPERFNDFNKLTAPEWAYVQEEMRRCKESFTYAARNYLRVVTKKGEELPFTLWEVQELILETLQWLQDKKRPAKLLILKARQLGASTLIESIIAWVAMFYPNRNCLVVSYDPDHCAYLFGLMQYIYDRMPWWLQPMCSSRKYEKGLVFENPDEKQRRRNPGLNSRVITQAANKLTGVGTGTRLNAAHLSEIALWEKAREVIEKDIKNALVEDWQTIAVGESTANGCNNYFYSFWKKMVENEEAAGWYPKFFPWFFEKSRFVPPPLGWRPHEVEEQMRESISVDWVRCQKCSAFQDRMFLGIDRSGKVCLKCNEGILNPYILASGQLKFMEDARKNAETDPDTAKLLTQELCSTAQGAFVSSGFPIFPEASQNWVNLTVRDPKFKGHFDQLDHFHAWLPAEDKCSLEGCAMDHRFDDKDVWVWEMPLVDVEYYIGADVGEGIGQDRSVAFVMRRGYGQNPDRQVALFKSSTTDPIGFAIVLKSLGKMYNEAEIAIEINKFDSTMTYLRHNLMYPNLYRWKYLEGDSNLLSNRYGWSTNDKTRKRIIINMMRMLQAKQIVIRSKTFAEEMKQFQREDFRTLSRSGAMDDNHDDEVMAAMICIYCAHESEYDEKLGYVPIQRKASLESSPWALNCSVCGEKVGVEAPDERGNCPKCGSIRVFYEKKQLLTKGDMLYKEFEKREESSIDRDYALL